MGDTLKLSAHYNQLKINVEIKDDRFSGLPYEILSSILTQLNTQELTAALCVCRLWRRRILACREAFSTLRLFESKAESANGCRSIRRMEDKGITRYDEAPLSDWCTSEMALGRSRQLITVQAIRDYVQELYLCMAHRQHYQNLVYQMSKCNFPNLRALHITEFSIEGKEPLIWALRNVAGTLSELFISTNRRVLVPFGSVLSICYNLTSFSYVHYGRIDKVDITNIPELPTALESLYLQFDCEAKSAAQVIEATLRNCPRLRTLDIQMIHTVDHLLFTLSQHCKHLERLYLFKSLFYNGNLSTGGVVQLHEIQVRGTGWSEALVPSVQQSTETLQALYLEITPTMKSRDELLTMTFSSLVHLDISFAYAASDDEYQFVARLLGCMPNLEEIELGKFNHQSSEVFDKIAKLRHLRRLGIINGAFLNVDALSKALFQFSKRRCLTTVKIHVTSGVAGSGDLLDSLAVVDSLAEIRLRGCPFISSEAMDRFCEKLQYHPTIATLELDVPDAITDRTLAILANMETIKVLEMPNKTSEVDMYIPWE